MVAATPTAPPGSRTTQVALAAAVGSGAMVAVQQRVNGGLQEALGDAVVTALVSFGIGLVLCGAVVLVRRRSRLALPVVRSLPGWWLLGGLGGATLVVAGAAAAPQIGVALLSVALVGGQTLGGLAVDGVGLGPSGRHRLSTWRAVGAGLCLLAIVGSVLGQRVDPRPLLLAAAVGAGLLTAVQQALNGRVREATGDAAVATLVNFVVGSCGLLLALAVREVLVGVRIGNWPAHWWSYLGGPLGATFVAVAAVVVRRLGVLRFGLAVTAGQLLGAVALDVTVPERGHGVAAATVVGAALTLVAVAVSGRR